MVILTRPRDPCGRLLIVQEIVVKLRQELLWIRVLPGRFSPELVECLTRRAGPLVMYELYGLLQKAVVIQRGVLGMRDSHPITPTR